MNNIETISKEEINNTLIELGYEIDKKGFIIEDDSPIIYLQEALNINDINTLNVFLTGRHRIKVKE